MNKNATGDDDIPGDVLKLLGEGGLKIVVKLINTIYETGEWPKDFTEVTMIALKKKPQAAKCSDHRTVSLIAHTAKIVAKILRKRIEKKIEDLIFVVPCIMLNSEIIPTRCNNCVYSSQWLYSTCFGRQFHPSILSIQRNSTA